MTGATGLIMAAESPVVTGQLVRAIREALGLTQVALGDLLDVRAREVRRWETEGRPMGWVVRRRFRVLLNMPATRRALRHAGWDPDDVAQRLAVAPDVERVHERAAAERV